MNEEKYPYPFDPLYDTAPSTSGRRRQQTPKWDVFEDPPVMVKVGSMEDTKWIDLGEKCGKIFAYIFGFILVLGGGVVSKGTLMFMVAQLSTDEETIRPYCNKDLDRNKRFEVQLPLTERIAWMWLIMFAFWVPQLGTFLRSARKLVTKTWRRPLNITFALVFLSESLMTIGVAIFVYVVLPRLDSVKALMLTNSVCFVPALLMFTKNLLLRIRSVDFKNDPNSFPILALDFLSVLAQASAFIVWPLVIDDNMLFFTIASGILISCGWWENFAPLNEQFQKMTRFENSRYFIYLFVSLWKCMLFFGSMLAIFAVQGDGTIDHLFNNFVEAFQEHDLTVTEVPAVFETDSSIVQDAQDIGSGATITTYNLAPVWVFLIHVVSTYMCYITGKWACKIKIQGFSYSFPINLTVPVSLSILILLCGLYIRDECTFYHSIPQYLFFTLPELYELNNFLGQQQSWIWLFWLLSQAWITAHTWMPKCEKLASTEKLYVRPMYEPFFIDQDLALNRRIEDGDAWRDDDEEDEEIEEDLFDITTSTAEDFARPHPDDSMTRIYACATMWHETKEEMMEFLKSIIRMDEDQNARRMVREQFQINMPDYYEFETHIFFDDAFVRMSQDDPDPQINEFVRDLVSCVDEAASIVHEIYIRLRPPKKYITPYGGRLVWTLPGKTKMIAHLKDKKKIRAKKRWSQVMYMYYLLGHKLMERNDISSSRKDVIAENTFLLALDGDIDFQPKAVHLLVELMKKNKTLGAACGRIHPLGSGPLAWYQMFEYAIGHWLQKATEHVIGCVLCSPGCFSLFRGKALMDERVMRKYTTKSTEAKHFVQYDQGEDRWLCTLLLQRGYRVEYAAASDAYTHCPEGFNEFYNQRRRWMPSTTANIIDLLMNYKPTVKINDNLSTGYMAYQLLLLCSTVLGPGTIFLMLIGSFVAVFQWSQWTSFLYNIFPLMVFVLVCALFRTDKIQLFVAGILSGIYSLVMMAVLVGIILQTTTDGWLAPSSLFFFCVLAGYVVTALMHPKEFNCLKYGLVYYVTIPSMYMLLVIYAVFNMNNVSWGTREVTVVPKPQNNANSSTPGAPKEEERKPKNWIINWCGARPEESKGAIEFSVASLYKCMWFTNLDVNKDAHLKSINKKLEDITKRLDRMEKEGIDEEDYAPRRRGTTATVAGVPGMITGMGGMGGIAGVGGMAGMGRVSYMMRPMDTLSDVQSITDNASEMQFENTWVDDESLQRGEVDCLRMEEYEFWNGLLDKYLHPIDDTNDKARIAQNLKDLRDKMVLAFFMINALFVLVIFLLTLNQDTIHIQWPFGYGVNFTYMEDVNQIWIYKEYLQLEPIGIIFLLLFASMIIIQFTAMLIHRFKTFTQIVANTVVNLAFWKTSTKNMTEDEIIERDAVELAKQLQKLKGAGDDKENVREAPAGRRKTAIKLEQTSRKKEEPINDLDTAFRRRYGKIQNNESYDGNIRRETLAAIERRKSRLTRPSLGHINSGYVPESTNA